MMETIFCNFRSFFLTWLEQNFPETIKEEG